MDPTIKFLKDETALDYVFNLAEKDEAEEEFEIPSSSGRTIRAKLISHDTYCDSFEVGDDEDEELNFEWTYEWSLEIGERTYRITATETTGAEDGPQSFVPDDVTVEAVPAPDG